MFRIFLSPLNSKDSFSFVQMADWLLKKNAMIRRLDNKDKDSNEF